MQPKDRSRAWNPYFAGALAGVLMALSVLLAGQYFGASTSFVRSAGLLEALLGMERVQDLVYFEGRLHIDWQWMFVVGIFIGSLISAIHSGTFRLQLVPDMWRGRFGFTPVRRALVAFCGGVVLMFGARLADG